MLAMRAAMTGDAVGIIGDAFANVLGPDIRFGMLVAAIAGVLLRIRGRVAGRTRRVVVTIQDKEFCVIKGRRFPARLAVALGAIGHDTTMHQGRRCGMAGRALLLNRRAQ